MGRITVRPPHRQTPACVGRSQLMKGVGKGPCRFGLGCKRPGCWYEHPCGHIVENVELIPCRFGVECTRMDCYFTHPSNRPTQSTPEEQDPENRVCVWFQKGKCRNGTSCKFKHIQEERDGNVI